MIALRISAFQPREAAKEEGSVGLRHAFVSRRDLHQLIVRCIDAAQTQFAIVNRLSNKRIECLDLSDARERVGMSPRTSSQRESAARGTGVSEDVRAHSRAD